MNPTDQPAPDPLPSFIRSAKQRGVPDASLFALLRQRGWPERRIYDALGGHYESELGLTIPSRGTRGEHARDAYLYLLAFITLGCWTVALFWLSAVLIDRAFPNALYPAYPSYSYTMRDIAGQLASILISFPIFLFVTRLIGREVERRPDALESGVRKWLTYIALVIAAMGLLGDAIYFLGQALSGDLTLAVALKELVLFVITLGVFSYYLNTVRAERMPVAAERAYAWTTVAAVCIALAFGFSSIGSPAAVRAGTFDQRRIEAIEDLERAIHENWTEPHRGSNALPTTLTAIVPFDKTIDPETKVPFRYLPGKGSSYRICATFGTEHTDPNASRWDHPAGFHCFALDASKPVD